MALAVSEALSNVVVHAYRARDEPGEMRVDAWIDDHALEVAVSDDGIGMAAHRDSPGLGLALMGQVSGRLRLESGGWARGLRVRMTFALN